MSVTLVPLEYMHRNKNRNERPTSKRALKPFENKEISSAIIHYRFSTRLYLIIFPKGSPFQLVESVERTMNLLLLLALLTNGYQRH